MYVVIVVPIIMPFLSFPSRLPYWVQSMLPRVFYIIEKSWNYYPFTTTGEYKMSIHVCIGSY